mmetsp:Transcript_40216/g.107852  ORF Transcript_40216/g.107852 Transcript_40216/m.107852 type:complete len:240 (-) Transcript_40216:39-758(-)
MRVVCSVGIGKHRGTKHSIICTSSAPPRLHLLPHLLLHLRLACWSALCWSALCFFVRFSVRPASSTSSSGIACVRSPLQYGSTAWLRILRLNDLLGLSLKCLCEECTRTSPLGYLLLFATIFAVSIFDPNCSLLNAYGRCVASWLFSCCTNVSSSVYAIRVSVCRGLTLVHVYVSDLSVSQQYGSTFKLNLKRMFVVYFIGTWPHTISNLFFSQRADTLRYSSSNVPSRNGHFELSFYS